MDGIQWGSVWREAVRLYRVTGLTMLFLERVVIEWLGAAGGGGGAGATGSGELDAGEDVEVVV